MTLSSVAYPPTPTVEQTQKNSLWLTRTPTVERYWIERARRNPADFITYLTDGEKAPAKHQVQWLKAIFAPTNKHVEIQAFPTSGKTSISVASLAWMIGRFPHLTHAITSVSEEQAKQRLSELREIISSTRYQNVFPHIHIDYKRPNNAAMLNIWSDVWISGAPVDYSHYRALVSRYGEPRDHTVFACGITSKSITGKRISGWLLIDDPHNETNSATSDQRLKVTNAIRKEFLSRFSPTSEYMKAILIMTPWAEDDAGARLAEDRNLDGSPVWLLLKTPIRDSEGRSAWPEVYTEDKIADKAAENGGEDGPVFQLMWMLIASAGGARQITLDMLRLPMPDPLPDFKDVTIICDFARSKTLTSDYTVFECIARDHERQWKLFVLDGRRFKEKEVAKRVDALALFCDEVFGIFGKLTLVLIDETDSLSEAQLLIDLRPDLPVKTIRPKGDKETRFKSPAGYIQNRRVYFNKHMPIFGALCSELISFPKAAHDDTVDPLSLVFQLPGWSPRGRIRAGTRIVKSPLML